jgi:hypothetical protein
MIAGAEVVPPEPVAAPRVAVGAGFGAGALVGARAGLGTGVGSRSRVLLAAVGADLGAARLGVVKRVAGGAGVGEPLTSSGGKNTTGEPMPRITASMVASGVGCGMYVGAGSGLLAFARPHAVDTSAIRMKVTPTLTSRQAIRRRIQRDVTHPLLSKTPARPSSPRPGKYRACWPPRPSQ